jgi:hypothetical protein
MTANLKSQGLRTARSERDPEVPDLHSQLEALFATVWDAEENWRFDDRIDLAVGARRPAKS